MFEIIHTYDFSDVAIRNYFKKFISYLILNVKLDISVLKMIMMCLDCTYSDLEDFISFICEIISEILNPISNEDIEKQKEKSLQASSHNYSMHSLPYKLSCRLVKLMLK